ncbi:hypothetical protein FN846DRAFT_914204 [Sphaerosporella brunnea]|uniref:Granulins domain-containing protein n=1 Tax=Sphaerosporella brunnea TaxID=1250544 RepID=A0A5J5ECJ9_9PEZI|nr:hypothetical protein FN846DRAFT_914204 [Sphaerosporella brunnea]
MLHLLLLLLTTQPLCPPPHRSCAALGRPEICCPPAATCKRTEQTLSGVFCCLREHGSACVPAGCPAGTYACAPAAGGACCPWGWRCSVAACVPGGGPSPPGPSSSNSRSGDPRDVDGDGLSGSQDPLEAVARTDGSTGWRAGGETEREAAYKSFTAGTGSSGSTTATGSRQGAVGGGGGGDGRLVVDETGAAVRVRVW